MNRIISKFRSYTLLFIIAVLSALFFSGGCGGSGGGVDTGYSKTDPNGPEYYSSRIAERLIAHSSVYDLSAFVQNSSTSVQKGDVLLYYPENGQDITAYPNVLTRLNDALEKGAVLAFVDVTAEDINFLTENLYLNLPNYLSDDAASEDRNAIEDFYAVAVRLDSEDTTVANAYAYFGTDLTSNDTDLTVTVLSGDEEIPFNPDEYTQTTDSADITTFYVDGNGNILSADPNPIKYDYVDTCVDDFLEWVKGMNSMKAVSEVSSDITVSSSAEASAIFPGVSTSFRPLLHVEPRRYYWTAFGDKLWHTHKAWHRDTSITFSILPLHHFSRGDDYYVITVTGNTDPSQQYAHLSHTKAGRIEGLGTTSKPGDLDNDNILGYNWKFQYTAQFMANPKITNGKITGTPVGTLHLSAPDTINSSKKITKGFKFTLEGGITGGLSEKDGLKGEISLKPKWEWESKEEYSVNDYERTNLSGGQRAGWSWEFLRPKNGSQGFAGVWLEDVAPAGRTSVNLKSEFVIKVSKAEWKKYPGFKLVTEFKSQEGATEGGGAILGIGNAGRRDYSYDWSKAQCDYTVPRPPHIAVTQAKFNYRATAAKGDTQVVTLQSEEDWKAAATASWIHLTTSDNNTKTENGFETVSGKATGPGQAQIMISVDPVTDGKPRGGKVVFRASDNETCVIDILQAGR